MEMAQSLDSDLTQAIMANQKIVIASSFRQAFLSGGDLFYILANGDEFPLYLSVAYGALKKLHEHSGESLSI